MSEMNDAQSMGTLLSRMTAQTSAEAKFTDEQVTAMIEILIPRMITNMPGMAAANLTCNLDRDPNGWTLRINKPR